MTPALDNPFASIEDAREYLTLLAQTVFETKLEIEGDVARESNGNFTRRTEALQLALYTLTRLEFHMLRSRRILNDLRTLRRLLFEERTVTAMTQRPQLDGQARATTLYSAATYRSQHPVNSSIASA
jgi:hypothetical protein